MALTRRRLLTAHPSTDPGLSRRRSGKGFRYVRANGRPASRRDRARAKSLVIPPAWSDVWIALEPRAHIQAVGTDEAGRRQYLYHPRWRDGRDRSKFARALDLTRALPAARSAETRALRAQGLSRERVLAAAFRLLDTAAPRVGSDRYFEKHGSRGLTTLQRGDATITGSTITLSFPSKSGQRALLEIEDDDLATVLKELVRGSPRARLLSYRKRPPARSAPTRCGQ